ncbi:helix-turn-helix transcriptional regulator [Candidatus Aquiluna sp. UB-MaderosW2red]|uniref:helix-turn-helix transcriptional regulator n=1 Tax=Candidatus Aquiluna sp. UB-MaderosW2red TaxID=1855377 RepID=UPI000875B7CB|nr:helix-turn-helix domain-containing protein [Candidatus Aquiluna sp. UB-MaderosW2red]SCX05672.1 Helix-turn-helix domain-containing protein [Candidatus Aquiluna sp. UB-MaderosW2red]
MRFTPRILGLVVSQARKEAGLTQQQLAQRLQVSRKWLSSLENGKEDVNLRLAHNVLSELGYSLRLEKQVSLDEKEASSQEALAPNKKPAVR